MKKMKTSILIALTFIFTAASVNSYSKEATTKTSFKVWGNCESCKKRIEKAAKTDGVKSAIWDVDSKIITISFMSSKISIDQIQQNIAKVGYDTEKYASDSTAYIKLPQCCQYERKK